MGSEVIKEIRSMIADVNISEIKAYDTDESLRNWTDAWRNRMCALVDELEREADDWLNVPSEEMTLEQARHAVRDLRHIVCKYYLDLSNRFDLSSKAESEE